MQSDPTCRTAAQRFWAKVEQADNGCWEWTAALQADGYGILGLHRKSVLAHRFAYELLVGAIPQELQIDHLCRNRACVNPAHLETVTQAENARRGRQAIRATHCSRGHEFTPENTYDRRNGQRACRACKRIHDARAAARRRGETLDPLPPHDCAFSSRPFPA